MIDTLLTIYLGVVISALTIMIILLILVLAKLIWDHIFDNY